MAVDNDVDRIFLHTPQIDFPEDRNRSSEQDIREIGRDHGAAPAVGQSAFGSKADDVFHFLIHTHVGHMHDFDYRSVHTLRDNPFISPYLLTLERRSLHVEDLAVLLSILCQRLFAHFNGYVLHFSAFSLYTVIHGDSE